VDFRRRLSEAVAGFAYGAVRFVARRVVYPGALGDVWEHLDRGLCEEAVQLADEMDWVPGDVRARALELKGMALEELGRNDEAAVAFAESLTEAPRAGSAGQLAALAIERQDGLMAARALAGLRAAYGEALPTILAAERDRGWALAELEILADRAPVPPQKTVEGP
jgi:hypothetical protein